MRKGVLIINDSKFNTLLALNENEQRIGLMHRKWPPPVMSFIYNYPSYNKFWMKDTPSPLDIVFCKNGSIHSIHEGKPYSLSPVGPDDTTDVVLEFPKGTCEKFGIKSGDEVVIIYE